MALLGSAAMLLWYDIVPERIAEHDDWHTREHFPERVGIPGFLRAQRWVTSGPGPRYFVVYDVQDLDVLSSSAYLDRLNHPTPWTSRMMPGFRGMVRGFCTHASAGGSVLGTTGVVCRYSAAAGRDAALQTWLERELVPQLAVRHGISSTTLLRSGRAPEMTAEQRIRGPDAGVDLVLLVTGYLPDVVASVAQVELSPDSLSAHGALPGATTGAYGLACLTHRASVADA